MANTLGRTWAQATLPWSGDTQTWGKGLGAATDTLGVSLGEVASVRAVWLKTDTPTIGVVEGVSSLVSTSGRSDTPTIGLTEVATLLSYVPRTDTVSIGITESASIRVLLQASDTPTFGVTESRSNFLRSARADTLTLGFAEVASVYAILTSSDLLGVSLQEAQEIAVGLETSDILGLSLTDAYSLLRTSWPKDLGISSSWEMGAKAAPGVWVEQAELLDNSFEKSEHMEGAGVWQKNAPSSGSGWNSD